MLSKNLFEKSEETIEITTKKLFPVIKFILRESQSFKIENNDLVVSGKLNEDTLNELMQYLHDLGKASLFRVKSKIKNTSSDSDEIIKYSASVKLFETITVSKERENILRILLVEDDEDLLDALVDFLKKFTPESIIESARNGLEAIKCISNASSSFHLIVSDVQMPKINGFELVKFIKRNNIRSDIVAFTGNTDSDQTLLDVGFTHVLRKSSNFHDNLEEFYKLVISYTKIIKIVQ